MIFGFIAVMFAVILGMGVAHLLAAIAAHLQNADARVYPTHGAWVILLLLLHYHTWWTFWRLQAIEDWNYALFLLILLGPTALFLAAHLVIPDPSRPGGDPATFYFGVSRKFFLILAFLMIWYTAIESVAERALSPAFTVNLVGCAALVLMALSRSSRLHGILTVGAWVLFATGVALYGFTLA